jgi:hypothetical protein
MCFCGIISIISASYYNEVNVHGYVKPITFPGTRKCTLYFAWNGALRGATERGYK